VGYRDKSKYSSILHEIPPTSVLLLVTGLRYHGSLKSPISVEKKVVVVTIATNAVDAAHPVADHGELVLYCIHLTRFSK
jgi:hypothetical protein